MGNFLVIMAGGSGTRFWPRSTKSCPKQFLSFGQPRTLFEMTCDRFDSIVESWHRYVVTTESLAPMVSKQNVSIEVLAEPQGRNTAPCVYWAAREVFARDPEGVMLVMPSDHWIPKIEEFRATVKASISWAREHDDLVTLGIKPTRPETGYGYLKTGPGVKGGSCLKVTSFVEKPNLTKAQEYVDDPSYFWNGGMFIWRAKVILEAFDRWMPEMKAQWEAAGGKVAQAYPKLTATSIDYGIMEKAENVVAFPLDCGWDDLGGWVSVEQLSRQLGLVHGDNVVAAGELVSIGSSGNIVDAEGQLVSLLGVNNLVVVRAGERLLVAEKSRAQEIKQIVEAVGKVRPDLL